MGKVKSFKGEFSFDERLEESKSIISKYPDRVPVIIERYARTDLPDMEKTKYLVPRDMSMGQFIHILSSRLHLAPGKALFVLVKSTLPPTGWIRSMNLSRMKMGFCICATAVRKPLAEKDLSSPVNNVDML
ncbi:hypothetical protein JRO89_XS03G0116300 [Xanthoceras sorbifolium]|uniref:Autophagy-related protein n=1 Tax=Xanthoceras sorbifolium TaxID=99658 RepID=A0ABQ8I9K1_9ROSI|nr:hypothetical protein JRO89_XS03G0116300 [Xanthoceras sorbifolium]